LPESLKAAIIFKEGNIMKDMNKNKIDAALERLKEHAAIERLKEPKEGSNIFAGCDDYELLAQNGQEILVDAIRMTCELVVMSSLNRRATPEETSAAIAAAATKAISQSPSVKRLVDSYMAFSQWHIAFAEQAAEVKEMIKWMSSIRMTSKVK
jgi:hypothetical protein